MKHIANWDDAPHQKWRAVGLLVSAPTPNDGGVGNQSQIDIM